MFPAQVPGINPDEFSRSVERRQMTEPGKSPHYPYCPDQIVYKHHWFPFAARSEEASLREQLLANDSLGG